MKKIITVSIVLLSLFGMNINVSARHVYHVSHRTRINRLYRHAYYEMRYHHRYKKAFKVLYRTERKYHYSYTYRPRVHHRWEW